MRKNSRGKWFLLSLIAIAIAVSLAYRFTPRKAEAATDQQTGDDQLIIIDINRPCRQLSVDEFLCGDAIRQWR